MEITDLPIEMQQQIKMQEGLESARQQSVMETEGKRAKLEILRMSKDIAMANYSTAAAGTTFGATDILSIASDLESFVNS